MAGDFLSFADEVSLGERVERRWLDLDLERERERVRDREREDDDRLLDDDDEYNRVFLLFFLSFPFLGCDRDLPRDLLLRRRCRLELDLDREEDEPRLDPDDEPDRDDLELLEDER